MKSNQRASGILLHPTSLPGPYGIGDFGDSAYRFVDALASAGQAYWQVLPIGPTAFADSPYACLSSFAGNTNLVSLDDLHRHGWLTQAELEDHPPFRERIVEYDKTIAWHDEMLTRAYERFAANADRKTQDAQREFEDWCKQASVLAWLDDYALFVTLKEKNTLNSWVYWPEEQRRRDPQALNRFRAENFSRINEHRFRQWLFYRQWKALRAYAAEKGVQIIGDLPIYVGHDCCDVWVSPDLFDLNEYGQPNTIAGVPPDSFSLTGQRWGNPIYAWDRHQATGYAWWTRRIDAALDLFDLVRIDHFRAFHDFWRIPANEPTAINGRWEDGPGKAFFDALGQSRQPRIIAEDLGDKMDDVLKLRDAVGLPGMVVIQFAFSGTEPERIRFKADRSQAKRIVYTGTHDNNTILGWWQNEAKAEDRAVFQKETAQFGVAEPNWAMMHYGSAYTGQIFVVPMQDILGLGASARMNTPSKEGGNWRWRMTRHEFESADWNRLRELTQLHGRIS